MIQPGGFSTDINGITSGLHNFVNFPFKVLESYSKKLSNKDTKSYMRNKNNLYTATGLNMIDKKIKKKFGLGKTLTNKEIKDIMKVIKYLKNRRILLKETATKVTSQEGGFIDFL